MRRTINSMSCIAAIFLAFAVGNQLTAKELKTSRDNAINKIQSGQKKTGLMQLKNLADDGDFKSSYLLGLYYLKSPHIVKTDLDISFHYFKQSGKSCYPQALNALETFFLNNSQSKYFAPKTIKQLREYCLTQSKLEKSKSEEPAPKDNRESVKEPVADAVKSDEISGNKNQEQQLETKITPAVIKKWAAEIPKNQNIVGGGSGFAISDDGYFLTNHHVVEGCDGFEITYNDLSGFGEVFAQNKKLDLAVVKVDAPTPYFAKFDLSELRLGEKLIALGYPVEFLFGDEASISEGALTNTEDYETRSRREGFLLTSLPIASGNSGGPVYSAYGGIRGVVSYGFNSEKYKEGYKEEYGEDLPFYINTINFNFMVSGIKAKDWLTNSVNLDVKYSKSDDEKLATDEVASIGLKALARVDCLED